MPEIWQVVLEQSFNPVARVIHSVKSLTGFGGLTWLSHLQYFRSQPQKLCRVPFDLFLQQPPKTPSNEVEPACPDTRVEPTSPPSPAKNGLLPRLRRRLPRSPGSRLRSRWGPSDRRLQAPGEKQYPGRTSETGVSRMESNKWAATSPKKRQRFRCRVALKGDWPQKSSHKGRLFGAR